MLLVHSSVLDTPLITMINPWTSFFFFFNDPAPTEISPLPLHDALPISPPAPSPRAAPTPATSARGPPAGARPRRYPPPPASGPPASRRARTSGRRGGGREAAGAPARSEEHTSELQSRLHLVCRLLLEKK